MSGVVAEWMPKGDDYLSFRKINSPVREQTSKGTNSREICLSERRSHHGVRRQGQSQSDYRIRGMYLRHWEKESRARLKPAAGKRNSKRGSGNP